MLLSRRALLRGLLGGTMLTTAIAAPAEWLHPAQGAALLPTRIAFGLSSQPLIREAVRAARPDLWVWLDSDGSSSPDSPPIVRATAGHIGSLLHEADSRAGLHPGAHFGLIEIDWQARDRNGCSTPLLNLQVRDVAGDILLQQRLPLRRILPSGGATTNVRWPLIAPGAWCTLSP